MTSLSSPARTSASLPWFSALQIGCLVVAAAVRQNAHLLRPVLSWLSQ